MVYNPWPCLLSRIAMAVGMTKIHMLCMDGFNTVYCLIENELCELERVCEEYIDDEPDD